MKRKILTLSMTLLLLATVFSVPSYAENGTHVLDSAGVLTAEQAAELDSAALTLSERYDCGIYIVTVADYTDYSSISVQDCAERIYVENDLGAGEQRNGVLLLLSMADRDYWLLVAGSGGFTAFTDYGQELLCDEFLDDFSSDDWYSGFSDYINGCGDLLSEAEQGTPVDIYIPNSSVNGYEEEKTLKEEFADTPLLGKVLIIAVPPCIISLIVCLIFGAQMKTARKKDRADEYIPVGGVNMRIREDDFTHRTESRVKIEHNDSGGHSGGTSVHSSGFSGRGGKF